MIRQCLQNVQFQYRQIQAGSAEYKQQVIAWTDKLLAKQQCVPDGYTFVWQSGSKTASNSAYLFDAAMVNIQYAQNQLQLANTQMGKQAFATCIDAAKTYKYVIENIMPQWTFRPLDVYSVPDARLDDLYGHYCLARAMAYTNVGVADLTCSVNAQLAAFCNAAHLYTAAAQLIVGDTRALVQQGQHCVSKVLLMRGDAFLDAWEREEDAEGAAKGLACYREAHTRLVRSGNTGCEDKVLFATERNGVHWLEPVLPEWKTLVQARITPLT